MINNVVLVGRLTRDVDLRYTSNGTAVGNFSLAVDRNFTNAQGERETDFINCVIWRRSAETLANYSRKGSLIGVTGRIQTRSYENNQGQTVYVTEVVADNFQLLEPKSVTEQRAREQGTANSFNQNSYSSNQGDSYQNSGYQQDNNSGQNTSNNDFPSFDFDAGNDPLGGSASPIDISDDDLPF